MSCRKTHVTFITRGISHAREGSQDMVSSGRRYLLKEVNIKDGDAISLPDGTDYLVVGYGKGRIYHDSAEYLVVEVAVEIFPPDVCRKSSVGFQDHKGNLCQRAKNVPASRRCSDKPMAFAIRSNRKTE